MIARHGPPLSARRVPPLQESSKRFERRRCRAEHSTSALRLRLASRCARGTFDALVISDNAGFVIAASGEPSLDADGVAAVLPLPERLGEVDGLRLRTFSFGSSTLFVRSSRGSRLRRRRGAQRDDPRRAAHPL